MDIATNDDFYHKIFGNNSKQCYTAILKKWNHNYDGLFDKEFGYKKIMTALHDQYNDEDVYFSLNTFIYRISDLAKIKHTAKKSSEDKFIPMQVRQTRNARHLNALVIDYDYYNIDAYKELTPFEFWDKHVSLDLPYGLEPTAVVDSGRGLYLIYAFKDVSNKWVEAYTRVAKAFANYHKHLGADPKCTDITRVIRVPGTINSKSNRRVEILMLNDTNYDLIKDFAFIWHEEHKAKIIEQNITRRRLQTTPTSKTKNTRSRKGFLRGTFIRMYNDFIKLTKSRVKKGYIEDYREAMMYITYYEALAIGYDSGEAYGFVQRLSARMVYPDKDELMHIKASIASKIFNNRHSIETIISKVNITEDEQETLDYLVSREIKKLRIKRAKNSKRRGIDGLTTAGRKLEERRKQVNVLKKIGTRNAEIASLLGIERQTVANDLKAIQSDQHRYTINEKMAKELLRIIDASKTLKAKVEELKNYLYASLSKEAILKPQDKYLYTLLDILETLLTRAKNNTEREIFDG